MRRDTFFWLESFIDMESVISEDTKRLVRELYADYEADCTTKESWMANFEKYKERIESLIANKVSYEALLKILFNYSLK